MVHVRRIGRALLLTSVIGWLGTLGCARTFERELSVLFQPEVNPLLIRDSFLVDLFGPGILRLPF